MQLRLHRFAFLPLFTCHLPSSPIETPYRAARSSRYGLGRNRSAAIHAAFRRSVSSRRRLPSSSHGVIEDGNLENITLDAEIADFERALVLLKHLRSVTYATRWKAYEDFWKDFEAQSKAELGAIQQGHQQVMAKITALATASPSEPPPPGEGGGGGGA